MNRFLALAVVIFLAACSQAETESMPDAKAGFESYVAALNSGDIDAAAAMYDDHDGFHWIERGGVQYDKGQEAADSLKALSQSGGKAQMTVTDIRVAPMSDKTALVSAQFDYAMFDDDGGQQFAFDGWMTVGMVKRSDGWKIAGGQTGPGTAEP